MCHPLERKAEEIRMKARIVLMLGVLVLAMAAFAPSASAQSGYGPQDCEGGNTPSDGNNVVECDPDPCKDANGAQVTDPTAVDENGKPCTVPAEVESGGADNTVAQVPESAKLAYTGASTQLMVLLASALIAGGALFMVGTRRFGAR
jgi:hypothetical protein